MKKIKAVKLPMTLKFKTYSLRKVLAVRGFVPSKICKVSKFSGTENFWSKKISATKIIANKIIETICKSRRNFSGRK